MFASRPLTTEVIGCTDCRGIYFAREVREKKKKKSKRREKRKEKKSEKKNLTCFAKGKRSKCGHTNVRTFHNIRSGSYCNS